MEDFLLFFIQPMGMVARMRKRGHARERIRLGRPLDEQHKKRETVRGPSPSCLSHVCDGSLLFFGAGRALAFSDELANLLAAPLADLLVEGHAALGLDRLASLAADLLVEGSAALGLDRLASLATDLLVELTAALPGDGLTALPSDLLVEGAAPLALDALAAFA